MRYPAWALIGAGLVLETSHALLSPLCTPGLESSPGTHPSVSDPLHLQGGVLYLTSSKVSVKSLANQQPGDRVPAILPRARGSRLLECAAQQQEPGAVAATEAVGAAETVRAIGGLQRVYETWRWRGHKINFRVEGPDDAPPILLIHGFGASVGHFRKNFPALVGEGYRVYAVDLLGFGASDKPKEVEYSLELWQELLTDFIADKSRNEQEQWVVMGNSIGGLLTLMLTEGLQNGRKVRGAVLFNTAGGLVSFRASELPFYLLPVMWFFKKIVFGPYFGPKFFAIFKTEENVRSVLKQVYFRPDAVDDDLVELLITPSDDEGACDVFLKVFTGPAGPTPESLLRNIEDTKVLALWGDSDPWTPLKTGLHAGASLGQYLDTWQLVVLPETGHCPHDENPDECHAAILPWLKTLG